MFLEFVADYYKKEGHKLGREIGKYLRDRHNELRKASGKPKCGCKT